MPKHGECTLSCLITFAPLNIRNEMSFDDIVNETGVWMYQPPNLDQVRANP
jgi:hypothetical protein